MASQIGGRYQNFIGPQCDATLKAAFATHFTEQLVARDNVSAMDTLCIQNYQKPHSLALQRWLRLKGLATWHQQGGQDLVRGTRSQGACVWMSYQPVGELLEATQLIMAMRGRSVGLIYDFIRFNGEIKGVPPGFGAVLWRLLKPERPLLRNCHISTHPRTDKSAIECWT